MSEQQQLLQSIERLVQALDRYTASNQALVTVLIESEEGEQPEAIAYMDGTPCL